MHILMVEREEYNYQVIKRTLDESGLTCEITWMPDEKEARERLQTEAFDLILIDSNELETFQRIITQNIDVPVVFMAGAGNEAIAVEALKLGAQDYLIKDPAEGYLKLLPMVIDKAQTRWENEPARRQTGETLRASRENLNLAQKIARVGSYETDLITGKTIWSDEMNRIFGLDPTELNSDILKIITTMIHPDYVEKVITLPSETIEKAMRGEIEIVDGEVKLPPLEYRIVLPDGTEKAVLADGHAIFDETGEPIKIVGIIQDITERKQTETEAQQQAVQLEALRQVGLELTTQLDLEALLYSIVSRAMELVGGTSGSLLLYRPERDILEVVTSVGNASAPVGTMLGRGEGVSGKVWQTGEPLIVDDYQHWPGRSAIFTGYPFTATVGVPIRWGSAGVGEKFLGVLVVLAEPPHLFFSTDADLLSLFATQAAIAIHNVRLYEETRRRSLEQETVSRIARALNTLNVDRAFPVLVESLRSLTGCDRVSLAIIDEPGEHFVMSTLVSPFPALEKGTVMPLSATAAAENVKLGRPHLTADLSTETDFAGEQALYQAGFRSRINLPLHVGGEVLGGLNLASRQLAHFRKDQLPVLQQIADALASSLENSRLFRTEQRERQAAETLRQAALALTTALHQDEVVEHILAQLQRVVPYDTCSVQLFRPASEHGPEEDRLEIVGGRGFPNPSEVVGLSFIIGGDNPNTNVVRTQAPVIVEDAPVEYGDFRYEPHIQAGIRAWLGVPMLVGKRLVGMITLDKRERGFYTQEHARLAEAFAAQAAVAIENAQLYEVERKWATQLAVVNQVARKAVSILDSDQLLQDIVTAIQEGFEYYNVILLQLNEKTGELGNQAIAGGFKDVATPNYRQKVGEGLIGWVAETGRSLMVNDVSKDSRYVVGFPEEVPTRSELCVPLKLAGQVMGVLDVQEARLNAFDETDLMAMETLADQVAVAIQNAQLYQQAQQDAEMMSVLLNEVNHRVKNNLTGIIGLLYLARSRAKVEDLATYHSTMDDLIGRVRGLASVHSMLSASEWTPLSLRDLAVEIIHAALRALPHDKQVSVNVPSSSVRVTSDQAHNLALVINELATNVVKYVLETCDKVQITFQVSRDDHMVRCEFRDNGPGYPEDILRLERHNVGFDLIQNIVRDNLRGELSLHNDHGAVAVIQFKAEV